MAHFLTRRAKQGPRSHPRADLPPARYRRCAWKSADRHACLPLRLLTSANALASTPSTLPGVCGVLPWNAVRGQNGSCRAAASEGSQASSEKAGPAHLLLVHSTRLGVTSETV